MKLGSRQHRGMQLQQEFSGALKNFKHPLFRVRRKSRQGTGSDVHSTDRLSWRCTYVLAAVENFTHGHISPACEG